MTSGSAWSAGPPSFGGPPAFSGAPPLGGGARPQMRPGAPPPAAAAAAAAAPPAKRARAAPAAANGAGGAPAPPRLDPATWDEGADDPHAELAVAVGLEPEEPTEEERAALPRGADEARYARARNAVLALWRADVSRPLPERAALAAAPPRFRAYALAGWRFLHAMGFINFGVAPAIEAAARAMPDTAGTAVVVGAGVAGLAAARALRAAGWRVVVVEARARPGGRVHALRMAGPAPPGGGPAAEAVADLGGSILTGVDGNPLAVVAKQLRLPLADIRPACPLFMPDGAPAPPELDAAVERHHNRLLEECSAVRRAAPMTAETMSLGQALESLWDEQRDALAASLRGVVGPRVADADMAAARGLFDWHMANLEFANASPLAALSLAHWDQDDGFETPGAHCFVPGGNGRWLRPLCRGVPIFYSSPVAEVRCCARGVAVRAGGREFRADAVVVTLPLGVLKEGGPRFAPPLPPRKLGAVARLGFGGLNKVVLLFPTAFWTGVGGAGAPPGGPDTFGLVAASRAERGESFLFYSYAGISGGAVLIALAAGAAADAHEARAPADAARRVMAALRRVFMRRGVEVPAPLQVVTSAWAADPYARGAYSSLPRGTRGGEDYDVLAESVGGRLFFAGEATTRRHPATMHGAFYSGLWAAANLRATRRRAAAAASAAAAAAARAAAPAGRPAREPEEEEPLAQFGYGADEAAQILVDARLLQARRVRLLFDDPAAPPDLVAGCVAAVHGPPGTQHAGRSLVRVRLGAPPLALCALVATDAALALADAPSDAARVALLRALPGGALEGRAGLPREAGGLVDAVLQARRRLAATAAAAAIMAPGPAPAASAAASAAPPPPAAQNGAAAPAGLGGAGLPGAGGSAAARAAAAAAAVLGGRSFSAFG
jgi:hypothetical protein